MDKDEILKRSRKENKDQDLVELEAINKANTIANTVGILVCALLNIIRAIFQVGIDKSVWTVMLSIMSTVMLVKFAKLRQRHELVMGMIYLAGTIGFFVLFLRDLLWVF